MFKLDPDFWVLLAAFSIILVHTIFPAIRHLGGRSARILNSMSSGTGLTHWLVFNTDQLYQYADNLHKRFYRNFAGEFFIFVFLCCTVFGFLFTHALERITKAAKAKGEEIPDIIYRIRLFLLFMFNYSSSHYIPTSSRKSSAEIVVYMLDCIVVYSLSDCALSETFPKKYNFSGRLFSILGVMLGILSGYFAPHQEHDWFMAYIDSFLMGCELMLLIIVEFSINDTEKHYVTFLLSVLAMLIFLGSYYYVNWKLLV